MTIDGNYDDVVNRLKTHGFEYKDKYLFELDSADQILRNAMQYFAKLDGFTAEWIESYNDIVEWLKSNENKGLFIYGDCGLGKSFIARNVLPAIFMKYHQKVVKVYDIARMNKFIDEVLKFKIVVLDDIGTEEPINIYGSKRYAFSELVDNAEKNGNILIITTNLTKDEIVSRYGERVLERIISTTKRVEFKGRSFRK